MGRYIVVGIVSLAVAIATVSAQTKLPGCDSKCNCLAVYEPVCGSDGETYTNEGCLACEIACKPGLKLETKGECNKTDVIVQNATQACRPKCACGQFWEPVCGTDGKTYTNEGCLTCEVECKADLKVSHKGECGAPAPPQSSEEVTTNAPVYDEKSGTCSASCVCTRKYEPVCASNGKTYSNEGCLYCAAKCKPEIKMEHEGECNSTETETSTLVSDSVPSSTVVPRPIRGLIAKPREDCGKDCVCAQFYSPVCGTDGQTYTNQGCLECKAPCKLGLKVAYNGECTTTPAPGPGLVAPSPGGCKQNCNCLDFWDPVCGSNGKTYGNEGCLTCEASCKLGLKVAYKGECSTTPVPPPGAGLVPINPKDCVKTCGCAGFWDPVCGSDGETYSNEGCLSCDATCKRGLKVAYKGECTKTSSPSSGPSSTDSSCRTECSCLSYWDPVCGNNGKTYSNEGCLSCEATCKFGLKLAYKGECSGTSVPSK